MSGTITDNGKPFQSRKEALLRQEVLKRAGRVTEVVAVDGGFVLETKVKKAEVPTARERKRIPLAQRNILKYPDREGYRRRVVNDIDDRIERYREAGWEVVHGTDQPGGDPRAGEPTQFGTAVGKQVGGGIRGVLMEIPEEWYEEDFRSRQDNIDRQEAEMMRNRPGPGPDGMYGEVRIMYQ